MTPSRKTTPNTAAKTPPKTPRRVAPPPTRQAAAPPPAPADITGPLIDCEEALDQALARLRDADPEVVDHLIDGGGRPPLRQREPGFAGLAAIIVSQQLSTSSAAAIFARLEQAVSPLAPEGMLAVSDEILRGLGLSLGKIKALRATAEAVRCGALPLDSLGGMPAEQAHAAMVAIKGIGPWTADIFLLFCLGHPDAWPAGDLALQEAVRIVLKRDTRPSTAELNVLAERWRPHRGVAARLLWAYYRVAKQGRSGMTLA